MTQTTITVPAEFASAARPEKPEVRAHLRQLDPQERLRGWEVWITEWEWRQEARDGRGAWVNSVMTAPSTPLQKPGIRPPTQAQRRAALTKLGYEPASSAEEWGWQESEWSEGRPYLFATLVVRPIGAVPL